MAAKNSFKRAIQLANSGQRYPVVSLVRSDPGLAATISKLIPGIEKPNYNSQGNREPFAPDFFQFKNTSHNTAQNITDAQTVLQILPDTELSAQILVSSIISPKDMSTTELNYTIADGIMAPDVSAAMIARVKRYFEEVYKIKPLLPKMLRDILFETGSYPVAVIPENSIDDLINGPRAITMESLGDSFDPRDGSVRPIGLLGPAMRQQPKAESSRPGITMESFKDYHVEKNIDSRVRFDASFTAPIDDSFVSVCDNPDILKIPRINQKIREQRIFRTVGSRAMENFTGKLNDRAMSELVYKERQFNYKPVSTLKTQEQLARKTVGNPLILYLPPEAVIPVHVPGNPEEQIGFFILLDADGNPISKNSNVDHYQQLASRLNQNGSFPSAMLSKVKNEMSGFDLRNPSHLDYSTRVYGEMVEQDLLARLRNGVYGNGIALAKQTEIYRIMLSRALAKQHSQLLFLPIELMTYMALRFDEQGIGKSLLEDMKILNSLRSMVMFANVMASLRNSIGRTEVKFKLDELDPDPRKTIELGIHEISRSRQQYFPLGTNSPTDLVDWLQRAGYEFSWEGHPGMPDVGMEFTEKNSNYIKPDTELEESLRKRAIMATGLSPDNVDAAFQADFATQVVANNLLLAKRVIQIQEQFMPQMTSHMRKAMMNSEELITDLTEILTSNFDKLKVEKNDQRKADQASGTEDPDGHIKKVDEEMAKKHLVNQFLTEFMMNMEVSLPKPNSVTLENQLVALETYSKALDTTLESWISESFFTTDTGGEVASQVTTIKAMLKAYYMRQWMVENGVMPELNSLTTLDSEGKPMVNVYDAQAAHIEALTKSLTHLMVHLQPVKKAADEVMNAEVGATTSTDTSTGSDTGAEPGGGFDEDFGSGDELDALTADTGNSSSTDQESTPPAEETPPADDASPPADAEPQEKPGADDTTGS